MHHRAGPDIGLLAVLDRVSLYERLVALLCLQPLFRPLEGLVALDSLDFLR